MIFSISIRVRADQRHRALYVVHEPSVWHPRSRAAAASGGRARPARLSRRRQQLDRDRDRASLRSERRCAGGGAARVPRQRAALREQQGGASRSRFRISHYQRTHCVGDSRLLRRPSARRAAGSPGRRTPCGGRRRTRRSRRVPASRMPDRSRTCSRRSSRRAAAARSSGTEWLPEGDFLEIRGAGRRILRHNGTIHGTALTRSAADSSTR